MELLRERKAARERERQEVNRQQQTTGSKSEGMTSTSSTSDGEHVWLVINSDEVIYCIVLKIYFFQII